MIFDDIFRLILFIFSILLLLSAFILNILLKDIEKEIKELWKQTRQFLLEINSESEENKNG